MLPGGCAAVIPRSEAINHFEEQGKTVVEGDPGLPVSRVFLHLAEQLLRQADFTAEADAMNGIEE